MFKIRIFTSYGCSTCNLLYKRYLSSAKLKEYQSALNLKPGATAADVRESFLRLSKIYHPDNKISGSHNEFLRIKEAYDALKNGVAHQAESKYTDEAFKDQGTQRQKYKSTYRRGSTYRPPNSSQSQRTKAEDSNSFDDMFNDMKDDYNKVRWFHSRVMNLHLTMMTIGFFLFVIPYHLKEREIARRKKSDQDRFYEEMIGNAVKRRLERQSQMAKRDEEMKLEDDRSKAETFGLDEDLKDYASFDHKIH